MFIRGRKLNISFVFITQSYFKVLKDVRLNFTHFFIMKIPNKRELQQIVFNHSSDINFKDFINIYKNVLLNHIFFWLMMLCLHQITLQDLEKIFSSYDKIKTINDKTRDEKLQYDINRETAKISAWSSGNIQKYDYLTGKELLLQMLRL